MSSFLRLLVLASVAGCLPEPKSFVVGDAGTEGALLDTCFAGRTPWMMDEF